MIPPVQTDPVWGRAQSGPVPLEGRTGPGPRLAVLDWTGLVWTSPNRILFINFKLDPKNSRSETVIPTTLTQTLPKERSEAKAQWEADICSKHFGYRLNGKAGNRRPIPMTSTKSLATGWKAGRCRWAQVSELFSMEICDMVVWTSWRPWMSESSRRGGAYRSERPGILFSSSFGFFCQRGRRVVGGSSTI